MSTYQLAEEIVRDGDPRLEALLAACHADKRRPLCLCQDPGIEMYVAQIRGRHIIKRMPNSGSHHHPNCDSYEPPTDLSGLGPLIGSAIQENVEEGQTNLRLDFSLSKTSRKSSQSGSGVERDSVASTGNKLSLRSTLHFLWEQAEFNRWSPSMSGKRTWYTVRKFLMQAAEGKKAKGSPLTDFLFVPEVFSIDHKDEITQRRMTRLNKPPEGGRRQLWLLVGEVKEIQESRLGHKLLIKHLPDFPIMLDEGLCRRMTNRFAMEFALWNALNHSHLVLIGTFEASPSGIATLQTAALMLATETWLPFESLFEYTLLDTLVRNNRRFIKGLRYSVPATQPLASAVLTDIPSGPVALYVVPPDAGEEFNIVLESLIAESDFPSWIWRAGIDEMPDLPAMK
ncbi:MAG: DUF1173 domain-containing protein [Methylococcaceae bacterium]|nr:DUF1173 domain-containing protein [Methylococcaceae bacterium]